MRKTRGGCKGLEEWNRRRWCVESGEWKAGREWEEGKGRTGRNKKLEQKVRV